MQNLRIAMGVTGAGAGVDGFQFLTLDHQTGVCSIGPERKPMPQHRWAVPVATMLHGYKRWRAGKVIETVLVPMATHPNPPTPPEPFVGFGEDGPRKVTQLNLHSLDEQGLALTFSSMGVSHDNRIRHLLGAIVEQIAANGPKFCNPVILLEPGSYPWHGKVIWHFDFRLLDWATSDGRSLQSAASEAERNVAPENLPWDLEGDDEDAGEQL
jgi:hypothetical protein